MQKKYVAAGDFFKQLREDAGFVSREAFFLACTQQVGRDYSCSQLRFLELGYKEPAIAHWQLYQRVCQCDPAKVLEIPGLISAAAA